MTAQAGPHLALLQQQGKSYAQTNYLACAIFLYAVEEQLLVGGLGGGHAGGSYQVGHHHLVPLCHQQLAGPNPLHLPAPLSAAYALSCHL